MALRRSRVIGVRNAGRATNWVASFDDTSFTAIAASGAVLDQSFVITEDTTIVRTRGSLWVSSDQVAAAEEPFGALGMAVATDQATAIGVTALPTPITDEGSDNFFLWMPWLASVNIATAASIANNPYMRYDFDSKAMRKANSGDNVVVTLENASGAHGVRYILKFRMLFKNRGG